MAFSVSPTNLWYDWGGCQSRLDFAPEESNLRFPSVGWKSVSIFSTGQLVLKRQSTMPCLSRAQERSCFFSGVGSPTGHHLYYQPPWSLITSFQENFQCECLGIYR